MSTLRTIIYLFCLSAIFNVSSVSAAVIWTGSKKVASIQVVDNGGIIIGFYSEINKDCTEANTSRLYVYSGQHQMTTDGVKSFLSVSLTALSTGMSVNIMYEDSSAFCWGRYIKISKSD